MERHRELQFSLIENETNSCQHRSLETPEGRASVTDSEDPQLSEIVPFQNVSIGQLVDVVFSWIAPPGYRRAYIKSEHLCVGYVVGLAISGRPKPEFNLPFSC